MNVCLVVPGLDAGGTETSLLRFLDHYPEQMGITVFVRSRRRGDLYVQYARTSAQIHYQTIGYLNIYEWTKVYKFFVQQKFTTVCDFGGNFAGITMLIAKLAGIQNRIAFYRRSSNAFSASAIKLMYNTWVNQLVNRYSTRILSNSQHALDYFFPYAPKDDQRFKVIPNGVNFSTFQTDIDKVQARTKLQVPQDRFIVGHVGRLDWSKNHETIFKVARKLKDAHNMVTFIFAGNGTDTQAFADKLKAYEIEDVCIGFGLLDNLPVFYKTMDLFYFPSLTEGQPNALIEAMMAGIPTLTSSIAPIKETMPPEMYELLLDPMNGELASSVIQRCIDDPSYTEKFKVNTEFLHKYDMERNYEILREELFRE